ncbi:hypothetical protein B0J14DRAFT_545439 [Halenospora varia]|nr:hypothetical protein B0J14DRAFT_545439 [Halenospora varia]
MGDSNAPILQDSRSSHPWDWNRSSIAESTNITDDGRIDVSVDSRLARTLSRLIPNQRGCLHSAPNLPPEVDWRVKLNIVIQVIGSRGDVQPFVALGQELQKHGHRIRLATHDVFEDFVRSAGLEFYPTGGDPAELMAYMVKNPGLIPNLTSVRAGKIQRKRVMIQEMLHGCWNSCLEPDQRTKDPFVADAIIANPPSFAHVHCAQALSIPVHLIFVRIIAYLAESATKAYNPLLHS